MVTQVLRNDIMSKLDHGNNVKSTRQSGQETEFSWLFCVLKTEQIEGSGCKTLA